METQNRYIEARMKLLDLRNQPIPKTIEIEDEDIIEEWDVFECPTKQTFVEDIK